MRTVLIIIGIGWIVFWVGWLIAAFTAKSSQGGWGGLGGGLRVGLVIVIFYLVRISIGSGHRAIAGPLLGGIGLVVWAAGLALAVWARLYIGRNWGMPMTKRNDPDLVTTGPYRLIRHPIYTGVILGVIGTALATSLYGLIAAAVMLAYFGYSAHSEERFLAERFPDTFPPYKARTKMLIPFLL
jgi:protein-S-isoprenylcysteine O-methyltransferase Ste14